MNFFQKMSKVIQLRKIQKTLIAEMTSADSDDSGKRKLAEEQLFDLISKQRDLKRLLIKRDKSFDDVKYYYEILRKYANTAVNKYYIPAAAISFRPSLTYLLDNDEDLHQSKARQKTIADVMTAYYENDELLGVSEERCLALKRRYDQAA